MTLDRLLPDTEALVITYLRDHPDVGATIGGRVYGKMPEDKTFPLIRITLLGGERGLDRPLEFEHNTIQVDVFGGTKKDTNDLMRRAQAALMADTFIAGAVVASRMVTAPLYLPDTDFEPPKARYTFDALVSVRAEATT